MPLITSITGAFTQQLAATLTRISVTPGGGEANSASGFWDSASAQVFSGDGRLIVFETQATNIVPGDTNGTGLDAVLRNLFAGTTVRVGLTSTGAQPIGGFQSATLSADGRYAFFATNAIDVVANDTNNAMDIFRRDLLTGAVVLVTTDGTGSQGALGGNSQFSASADGRYAVFTSAATTLVGGDTNSQSDVFRKDLATGAVERVSTATGGTQATGGFSSTPSISADGRYVVFASTATNLVTGDTNGLADIFLKDMATGATTRVSTDSAGNQATGSLISSPRISADGRYVTFETLASNLVSGDTNGQTDIFRKDLLTGAIVRVNADSSGAQAAGGPSDMVRISADGRFVVFRSDASNLVSGDTNGIADAFLKDLTTGAVTRVTFNPDTNTQMTGLGGIFDLSISADGRFVAIDTTDSSLVAGDTNGSSDVLIYDTYRSAVQAGLANGGKVVTLQVGTNGGDLLDVYWGDGATNTNRAITSRADATLSTLDHTYLADGRYTITALSTNPGGAGAALSTATAIIATDFTGLQMASQGFNGLANSNTNPSALSPNGRYVVLNTPASNLLPGYSGNAQLYIRDMQTGEIAIVSSNAAGVPGNQFANIDTLAFASDDGVRVVFASNASNLLPVADANGAADDVFLKNVRTGAVTLLSATQSGVQGNGVTSLTDASSDLTWVVMNSSATIFGNGSGGADTNGFVDVFLKNTQTGEIRNVAIANGVNGVQGNLASSDGRVSADGRYVAFTSDATNLVTGDSNVSSDVFLRDTQTNATTRVSLGLNSAQLGSNSTLEDLSNDGSLVLFKTNQPLVAGDGNIFFDLYSRNIATGALTLVSSGTGGTPVPGLGPVSLDPSLGRYSDDGRYVTFRSVSVFNSADTNFAVDVFRKDLLTGDLIRISSIDGIRGGLFSSSTIKASADGQTIAFGTNASDLIGASGSSTQTLLWKQGGAVSQGLSGNDGVDIIQASEVRDVVSALAGNDSIFLRGGNDSADAGPGNDLISGGPGLNALTGGGGYDRALYNVAASAVTITTNASGTKTITGAGFTDTLSGVEVAQFSDGTLVSLLERTNKGDLSSDGRSDILLRNSADGSVFVWEVNGTSLGNSGGFGWAPGAVWKARGTGDFNGDGRADVLLQNSDTGQSFFWFSNGVGSSVSGASGTVGWAPGAQYVARATGDFNGDGRSDILLQDSTNGQCFTFLTDGTSVIGANFIGTAVGANWVAKATGDFNGDGKSDILFQNSNDGTSYIWNLNGTTIISNGQPGWTPGADWQVRGTGDFNRDGKSDILLQNAVTGQLFTFMVDGTTAINSGTIGPPVGAGVVARGTGDFNGDGQSDILFQDTGSGTSYVWLLDGTAVTANGQVGWVPGAQWEAFV